MLKALRILLIIFGFLEILLGLGMIVFPEQMASTAGVSGASGYLIYIMASLGICLVVFGVFLIIAARYPLKHIDWVKYAIAMCILGALTGLYAILRGAVDFGQVGMPLIMDSVFAVIFLALFPYKAAKGA